MHVIRHIGQCISTILMLCGDGGRYLMCRLRSPKALAAENLLLRKQLALYQERHVKPQRATDAPRLTLTWLARCFNWRQALVIVHPATLIRRHRQGFRLLWRWKSTLGRPPILLGLQALVRRIARENPSWGEEGIANELVLKLGLRVAPRTVRKYPPKRSGEGRRPRVPSQRWRTFVRNHAQAIVACDFCVAVIAAFRLLYVLVITGVTPPL
jgi:putative transposase